MQLLKSSLLPSLVFHEYHHGRRGFSAAYLVVHSQSKQRLKKIRQVEIQGQKGSHQGF